LHEGEIRFLFLAQTGFRFDHPVNGKKKQKKKKRKKMSGTVVPMTIRYQVRKEALMPRIVIALL